MAISRLRTYQGPPLLSFGFRPFFLFGSIYAGAIIPIWLAAFEGELEIPTLFLPRDWHVHEMLFGYVAAIIGGFLLTAVPNWTGRLPLQGTPLAVLVSSWFAGRVAVCASAWIGWAVACAIDVVFLTLLAAAAAREIVAGKKWNNLPVVAMVTLLAASNLAFHFEAHFNGTPEYSTRFAIALTIVLVTLIGGRIVPSFTRNLLARHRSGRLPVPFGRFDSMTIAAGAMALAVWIAAPTGLATGAALIVTGCLHLVRLTRWAGYRTASDRLVLILHLAYAFVPLGFVLTGFAALDILPTSAGVHAWTAGAIGTMTLAVMTRATLGHTGRALEASIVTQSLYAAIILAALLRICASVETGHSQLFLAIAGTSWTFAFVGFAVTYARALCSPRTI